jgi:hypothetical protein
VYHLEEIGGRIMGEILEGEEEKGNPEKEQDFQ